MQPNDYHPFRHRPEVNFKALESYALEWGIAYPGILRVIACVIPANMKKDIGKEYALLFEAEIGDAEVGFFTHLPADIDARNLFLLVKTAWLLSLNEEVPIDNLPVFRDLASARNAVLCDDDRVFFQKWQFDIKKPNDPFPDYLREEMSVAIFDRQHATGTSPVRESAKQAIRVYAAERKEAGNPLKASEFSEGLAADPQIQSIAKRFNVKFDSLRRMSLDLLAESQRGRPRAAKGP